MKPNPLKFFLVLFTVASFVIAGTAQARVFKDTKGREIEAEIVATSGTDKIIISRAGKEFPVPINMFSLDDQTYIKEWIKEHPDAERLDVKINWFVDLKRAEGDSAMVDKVDYDERLQTQNWVYDFSISNAGPSDLSDVRVVYQILIEDIVDANGNFRRMSITNEKAKAEIQRIKVEVPIESLPANKRADIKKQFSTEKYVDRDGRRVAVAAQDKITGIWIRIYKGDKIIADYSRPATGASMRDIPWDDNETRSPTAVIR